VLCGQGQRPEGYDPVVDVVDTEDLRSYLADMRETVAQAVAWMPTHEDFIATHCAAAAPAPAAAPQCPPTPAGAALRA
jgi:tryptophan 7-halogenase